MVIKKNAKIEWTVFAKDDLKTVLNYYKKKSTQGYILVKKAIVETVISASKSPEIFKIDNLTENNDGTIRVFIVYHTRVVYQITEGGIVVLRLRHTSREPFN
jgi:plasmid stabilization system protein ParE